MADEPTGSLDILGLKPYGEAINTATKGLVEGAGEFLGRICLPAAEELGLLFRDRVSHWRAVQFARIAEKGKRKLDAVPESEGYHAHPRILGSIVEHGSWADSDDVQEMWAGLLASACTEDGNDESNLIFVNLLSQLTSSQAKVLAYGVERVEKALIQNTLVIPSGRVFVDLPRLITITGVNDVNRIDRELDHLRAVGLMTAESGMFAAQIAGIGIEFRLAMPPMQAGDVADLAPSALGLQMYVRCQGSRLSPAEYFQLTTAPIGKNAEIDS